MGDAFDLLHDTVNVIVDQTLRWLLPLVAIFLYQNFPKATRSLVWFHIRLVWANGRPVLQNLVFIKFRCVALHKEGWYYSECYYETTDVSHEHEN